MTRSPAGARNAPASIGARLWLAIGLAALTLAVYHPVQGHQFLDYDDGVLVVDNPHVVGGLTWENVRGAFLEPHSANWTPLAWVSLQVDRSLFGDAAAGVLLHNVAQHALAAILLFLALARMTGATWPAAFVAAVFAVHPLHVESVAWASERRDTLSGLLGMAVLLLYAHHAERPRGVTYALLVLAVAAGLLAKSVLVTLPLCLLLLDHWPLRRLRDDGRCDWPDGAAARRAILEKLPLLALSAAVSVVTVAAQRAGGGTRPSDVAFPLALRLENAVRSYAIYLRDAFWPLDLSPYHPFPIRGLPLAEVGLAAVVVVALVAIALASWRARPFLFVGIAWFLGMLVPMIGIVHVGHQAHADRYMYLPLIGLAIAVAWTAEEITRRAPVARVGVAVAGVVVIGALAVVAGRQVPVWRDTVTLFEHAARVDEDNFFALHRLAVAYHRRGDSDRAERLYREAVRAEPNFASGRIDLAAFLRATGRPADAIPQLERAVALRPDNGRARRLLAYCLLETGRFREAQAALEEALRDGEDLARLHAGLGFAALALGQPARAVEHNRRALALDPRQPMAANNLAWTLATAADPALSNPQEAIRVAESALELEPDSASLLDTLAAAYASAGRFDAAIAAAQRAVDSYERSNASELAGARERLALYRQGRPFVE